jgi:hypothetical protein
MRITITAALLLAAIPAMAQQPQKPPGQIAAEIQRDRIMAQDHDDAMAALQLGAERDALRQQVAELTKERDALRAPKVDAPVDAGKSATETKKD